MFLQRAHDPVSEPEIFQREQLYSDSVRFISLSSVQATTTQYILIHQQWHAYFIVHANTTLNPAF